MNVPSARDIEYANNILNNLESMLASGQRVTNGDLEPARSALAHMGFSYRSTEFSRFDEIKERALHLRGGSHVARYFGIASGLPMQIRVAKNDIILVHAYRHFLSVSWKFDSYGRIRLIDAKVKVQGNQGYNVWNNDRIYHIAHVRPESENLPDNWQYSPVVLESLPDDLTAMDSKFYILEREEKFSLLFQYGHSTAKKLSDSLLDNDIVDSHIKLRKRDEQRPLSSLKGDTFARSIIEKAAHRKPLLQIEDFPYGYLVYE
jgi:hypothetical protein